MAIINLTLQGADKTLLLHLGENNIRFITAKSLTKTAQAVQTKVKEHIKNTFVQRKKSGGFENSIRIKPATKQNLQAEVYTMAGFASLQQTGGINKAKSGRLAIPLYDNIAEVKNKRRAKDVKDSFLIKLSGGGFAIATRKGKGLRILYALKALAYVPKRLNMLEIGEQTAIQTFNEHFRQALSENIS